MSVFLIADHFGRFSGKDQMWYLLDLTEPAATIHIADFAYTSSLLSVYTCMPGGEGSLRTSMRISCLLESRALTASWCVACRRSMVFTSKIRSPTRSPLWEAKPLWMTYPETNMSEIKSDKSVSFLHKPASYDMIYFTFEMNTPGSLTPNGWLAWSLPPTMLRPRGPPALIIVTSCPDRKFRCMKKEHWLQ